MNEVKILYADHGTDLKSYLSNLNTGDINLMAGNHLFQFHRQYLAAVSPLFRHLLQSQPFSDTITLDGVSPDILQCLIHILYYGETQVYPDQLNHLTSLINDLEMTFELISDKLNEIITNEDSCDVEEIIYVEDCEEETNKVEWIEDGGQIEDLSLVSISDEALLVESSSSAQNKEDFEIEPKFAEKPHKKKQKRFKSLPSPSNPVSCEQCDQIFTSYTGLASHMLSHKNEKPFECEECGARFRQVSQLKTHKRIHSNEKAFICEECGKSFRHHDSLKEHRNLHTGETPFACDVCGKAFRQKKMLRIHNCCSDNIWPRNCVKCGEELQSARALTAHKILCREVFACKYCDLSCSSEKELKEHIAIHKAETRQCNYCDAYFDDLADLNDHLMMHTNSVF